MAQVQLGIQAIFNAAAALPAGEDRERFLDAACAGDESLRERVAALLRAHSEAGDFFGGKSPAVTLAASLVEEKPGVQIGPYKLLQEIGQGGMGVVFMAEQIEPVRRKVALKIIKPGMDTRQVIARFEAERQALSLMDHPNIARVLDAGTTEGGRPYFVMELVKGQPITEYCDEKQLTPRQRLELLLPVCLAIQHAHQKGIIHRDIKPTNILVAEYDEQPVPKVIDFGVAKAISQPLTEKTMFTGLGQIVGTLEYMSPEQAKVNQLDIDTRSDVYALGVLMYELLTGSTPLDKRRLRAAAWDEMLRIIREEEPPKPSTRLSDSKDSLPSISACRQTEPARLTRLVRGELDWIVMKALEKDRSRRYGTASGLADDIHRYLQDEPILACPPSKSYRFRKFARRHRVTLTTFALVATTLVLGTVVSCWQAIRAYQAEQRAQHELTEKEQQHARAEANFLKSLEAVDELLTEVGQRDLASMPQLEHVRRRLLEKALRFFQSFLQANAHDPRLQFETSLAQRRVGDILFLLGQQEPAEQAYDAAIELLNGSLEVSPTNQASRHELAKTHHARAILRSRDSRIEPALDDNAVERQSLEQLVTESSNSAEYQNDLANSYNLWAALLKDRGQFSQAEQAFRRAINVTGDLVDHHPDQVEYRKILVKCQINLADLLSGLDQAESAEVAFAQAARHIRQSLDLFDKDEDLRLMEQVFANNHGRFLWRTGRLANAEQSFRTAAELAQKLAADFPNVPVYRQHWSGMLANLGILTVLNGRTAEGQEHVRKSLTVAEQLATDYPTVAEYHSRLAATLNDFSSLLGESGGAPQEQRQLLERAVQHQQAACQLNPLHQRYREFLGNHYLNLVNVLKNLEAPIEELDKAEQQALALARGLTNDYPDKSEYQCTLGSALTQRAASLAAGGKLDEARQLLEEALRCHQRALAPNDRNPAFQRSLQVTQQQLAQVQQALQRPKSQSPPTGKPNSP